jgi:broad specificity phosphatase PhoE
MGPGGRAVKRAPGHMVRPPPQLVPAGVAAGSRSARGVLTLVRMTSPARWWFVRHAESTGNLARDAAEHAGADHIDIAERDPDVPLSPRGEQQAAALAASFAALPVPPTVIATSPFVRARATADPIAAATGAQMIVDERLREKELGALDRLTGQGVLAQVPREAELRARVGKFYYRPPGGESWCDVVLRLRSALADLRTLAGKHIAVITHQIVILGARYIFEQLDEHTLLEIAAQREIANTAITEYDAHRELIRYNEVP